VDYRKIFSISKKSTDQIAYLEVSPITLRAEMALKGNDYELKVTPPNIPEWFSTGSRLTPISQDDIMGNLLHLVMLKVVTGLLRNVFYLVRW